MSSQSLAIAFAHQDARHAVTLTLVEHLEMTESSDQFPSLGSMLTGLATDFAEYRHRDHPSRCDPIDHLFVQGWFTEHVTKQEIHGVSRRKAVVEVPDLETAAVPQPIGIDETSGHIDGHRRDVDTPVVETPVRQPNCPFPSATGSLEGSARSRELPLHMSEQGWRWRWLDHRSRHAASVLSVPGLLVFSAHGGATISSTAPKWRRSRLTSGSGTRIRVPPSRERWVCPSRDFLETDRPISGSYYLRKSRVPAATSDVDGVDVDADRRSAVPPSPRHLAEL